MADREQPDVDVPALTALLDGKYAEIRQLTRKNLAEYAGVLDDAIEMPRDEFRERVLELVRLMAATGATGLGFPTEYGGGGDIGASVAAFETLAFGDLSILVKVGRAVRPVRRRDPAARLEAPPRRLPRRPGQGRPARLLRDDRDGSRLQRAGAGHRRGVRPRREGVRDHDSGRPVAQGLHRQRRRARVDGGGVRPARDPRQPPRACTRSSYRSGTRRGSRSTASGSRTTDRRSASTASTTAGSGSTASASRAPTCSTATPT